MDRVLLLNAGFEPLRVVHWTRAFGLIFQEKVEIIEEYSSVVRTVSQQFNVPAVIRLRRWVNLKRKPPIIRFSRANIYLRDEFTCQYCWVVFPDGELTLDHVIPVVQGGRKSWENIVAACVRCNQKKSDRTPKQARMALYKKPKAPRWLPAKLDVTVHQSMPKLWEPYLGVNKPEKNKEPVSA